MPFVHLQISEGLEPEAKARLATELSRACAEALGKPESYVMVAVSDAVAMLHAGKAGGAAFLDVRSIGGLSPKVNQALCRRLCEIVARAANVPSHRTYLNFTDVAAANWGHDGGTFG